MRAILRAHHYGHARVNQVCVDYACLDYFSTSTSFMSNRTAWFGPIGESAPLP